MIRFKKLRWKNLLSTGNHFTEILLDEHKTTVLTGTNGAGKCVRGSTLIDIRFKNIIAEQSFNEFVGTPTVRAVSEFYEYYPQYIGELEVFTRHGYKTIEYADITAYDSQVITLETQSQKILSVSPDHLLFSNHSWTKTKNLSLGDCILTQDGEEKIIRLELEKETEDLYDLQVEEVKEYYANGIVSHNSTILDALCFALYGKAYRPINKPQLINTVNERDCRVEIEFTIGKTRWQVNRGMKPTVFEIWKNDKMLNQSASSLDQQKWLEKNVLKMNFRAFTQIVILGSSAFIPFMQLVPAHRREVIENLLDIQIFSSMNVLLKEKLKEVKDEIRTLEFKKESLFDKYNMQKAFIEELKNQSNLNINNKRQLIQNLIQESEAYLLNNETLEEEIFSKQKELENHNQATQKLRKLQSVKGKFRQKLETLQSDFEFFETQEICPTCTQTIDSTIREERLHETLRKKQELEAGFEELKKTILDEEQSESEFLRLSQEITNLSNEITKNLTRTSGYQRQIRDLETEIQTIENQIQNQNTEHEKLRQFEESLQEVAKNYEEKKNLIYYYDFCYGLLKDDGVKTKIIKKYLPLINQQVNRFLQLMDFYINFTLDEEFNEKIESPIHENFSYSSFSEGEKARINLALIFAWREIARIKNSTNCNIILFDEVFDGSLDSFGTDEFLKIIRYVIENANVIVISHKTGLEDKFSRVIQVSKVKGFSKIESKINT